MGVDEVNLDTVIDESHQLENWCIMAAYETFRFSYS